MFDTAIIRYVRAQAIATVAPTRIGTRILVLLIKSPVINEINPIIRIGRKKCIAKPVIPVMLSVNMMVTDKPTKPAILAFFKFMP